jgi:hypothetical protein
MVAHCRPASLAARVPHGIGVSVISCFRAALVSQLAGSIADLARVDRLSKQLGGQLRSKRSCGPFLGFDEPRFAAKAHALRAVHVGEPLESFALFTERRRGLADRVRSRVIFLERGQIQL